ncbi:hypothetical protein DPMN_127228 [Dreissena polymorpha]|uniref:Uncharacterized protein n=1 Tax=Dreissena polymorpha TaxID=45954 RepID=A0A9D4GYJ7_DREPO|nr:hypothetical protein DPMN_127228 [Dreissena polymorpha]
METLVCIVLGFTPLANPPGQHTQSQANTYVAGLILILLEILTSGHLSSWQYLPQGITSVHAADWVARARGHLERPLQA